jgi:hypothetical protein
MQAQVGDRILIHGNVVGQSDRQGEIIEVRGLDGSPPYVVRFEDGMKHSFIQAPTLLSSHSEIDNTGDGLILS